MLKWEVENPGDISFLENKANELRDLAEVPVTIITISDYLQVT